MQERGDPAFRVSYIDRGSQGIDGAEGEPEATINGDSSSVELQIPLELPDRSVAKIASLRGKTGLDLFFANIAGTGVLDAVLDPRDGELVIDL